MPGEMNFLKGDGTTPALPARMRYEPSTNNNVPRKRTAPVLRWEFLRGQDRLSCLVDRHRGSGLFGVGLVSTRGSRRGLLETFQALSGALTRHATLAAILRANGWKLAAYTA